MPKARDPKIIEAIEMVANGVSPRQAWEQCGMPNGEAGIQNIRKGGRDLKAQRAAQQEEVVVAEPEQGPAGTGKGHPAAGFRLRAAQAKAKRERQLQDRQKYDEVYKEATAHYQLLFQQGRTGKGQNSASGVAASFANRIPDGFKLTGRMLTCALQQGRSGQAKRKPGPACQIPDSIVGAVSTFAQLKQVAGEEQTPRNLTRANLKIGVLPCGERLIDIRKVLAGRSLM